MDDLAPACCLTSSILPAPIRLDGEDVYRIGRDRDADVCLPSTHVSRIHAEVRLDRREWVVVDLNSRNGTFVNGERVLRRALRDGDKIGIGQFEVVYRELTDDEADELRPRRGDAPSETLKISQDEIGFFGDLRKLSVPEVVQLLGQNRKTGVLTIVEEKGAPPRRLGLVEGAIVHAEFGSLEGERAVVPILRARSGKFAFRPTEEAYDRVTVETPTAALLLQAMSGGGAPEVGTATERGSIAGEDSEAAEA